MKTWMFALLGVTPNLVAWNYAAAEEPAQTPQTRQIVVVRDPAQAGQAATYQFNSEDGTPHVMVVAKAGADGEVQDVQVVGGSGEVEADVLVLAEGESPDGRSQSTAKKVRVLARTNDPDAANRGWLGVAIEAVPDAVAAQSGRTGVMISNVVEGSPAAVAGLQVNDVITAINGEAVGNEVGPAVDLIKNRKPGEAINVGVVRGNQALTVKATLGSRADMTKFEWKFEGMPTQIDEQIKTRGKFMLRGPDGELVVKDLGEIHDIKNLPESIRMFVPQSGSRSTQVFVNNGQKTIKMNVEKDGTTTSIEQTDGGAITVRRTDEDGQESVATYDNADALKAADAEAFELYSHAGQHVFVHVDGEDADGAPHIFLHGGDGSGEWRMHLEQSLSEAKEAYGAAMEELHENMMELKNQGAFDVEKFHEMIEAQGAGKAFTFRMGKPAHRFTVNADGSIEATIRKGDSEVVQKFRNESDLANRRPDLYEKYEDVKAADEE